MRSDMHRVIITPPRRLESIARKGRAKPLDEMPSKEGMRRGVRLRGGDKTFRDFLNPLRRYLAKQVGRPWNKVHSEIMSRRRLNDVLQQHLMLHVRDFVAIKPRRRPFRVGIRPNVTRGVSLWNQSFYVDERDGILKRTDMLPEEKARLRKSGKSALRKRRKR